MGAASSGFVGHASRRSTFLVSLSIVVGLFLVTTLPSLAFAQPTPQCADGVDNDADGRIDLGDAGCLDDAARDDESGEFVVNSALDQVDAVPGDGVCSTGALTCGPSGTEPCCTLRGAIMESNALASAQGVRLPAGTFDLTIPTGYPISYPSDETGGDLDITDDLIVIGEGEASSPISATFATRVLEVAPAIQVSISGVTIQSGRPYYRIPYDPDYTPLLPDGCGILNNGGSLKLTATTVSENNCVPGIHYNGPGIPAAMGAGIASLGGELTLINSTISGNRTETRGGGILVSGGVLTITDSTLIDNYAYDGGGAGLSSADATVAVTNSTIRSNGSPGAYGKGAGMLLTGAGMVTVTNSSIRGNYGQLTGAIVVGDTTSLEITDSAIIGNFGGQLSGGIRVTGASPVVSLTNTTLSGNSTYDGGGAIENDSGGTLSITNSTFTLNESYFSDIGAISTLAATGTTTLLNTVMSGNLAGSNCGGAITSLGHNLSDDATCNLVAAGDLPNTPGMLNVLADNGGSTLTHHPLFGSPLIDGGSNAGCPSVDQRGESRPADGDFPADGMPDCDIGAVEVVPEPGMTSMLVVGMLYVVWFARRPRFSYVAGPS